MEADFVNVFIEKQREVISDLTSKNVMAEARLAFAEQKLLQVQDVIEELNANKEHVVQLMQQLESLNQEKLTAVSNLQQLIAEFQQYQEQSHSEAELLRADIKKLNSEKEVYEAKAARLKNKAKQIAEE